MRSMKQLIRFLAVCALAATLAACAVTSGRETIGEYIDDATITTKVKAALFDEPSLKSMQVSVETFQDVVQLSGFVDSSDSKNKAGEVASSIKGVRSVRNDLVVR